MSYSNRTTSEEYLQQQSLSLDFLKKEFFLLGSSLFLFKECDNETGEQ